MIVSALAAAANVARSDWGGRGLKLIGRRNWLAQMFVARSDWGGRGLKLFGIVLLTRCPHVARSDWGGRGLKLKFSVIKAVTAWSPAPIGAGVD